MSYEKISYNFFRNRRKFDPRVLFYKNKDLSYEEFCEYFDSKNVYAPDFEYYERVKNSLIVKVLDEQINKDIEVQRKKTKRKRKKKKDENN